MRPEFKDWLKQLTVPQITACILCAIEELESRDLTVNVYNPELWGSDQWTVTTQRKEDGT